MAWQYDTPGDVTGLLSGSEWLLMWDYAKRKAMWTSDGRLFLVYDGKPNATSWTYGYAYSNAALDSWTVGKITDISAPSGNYEGCASLWIDASDNVYVVMSAQSYGSANLIKMVKFTRSGNDWSMGTIRTLFENQSTYLPQRAHICKETSTGRLWVTWNDSYGQAWYSDDDGVTWHQGKTWSPCSRGYAGTHPSVAYSGKIVQLRTTNAGYLAACQRNDADAVGMWSSDTSLVGDGSADNQSHRLIAAGDANCHVLALWKKYASPYTVKVRRWMADSGWQANTVTVVDATSDTVGYCTRATYDPVTKRFYIWYNGTSAPKYFNPADESVGTASKEASGAHNFVPIAWSGVCAQAYASTPVSGTGRLRVERDLLPSYFPPIPNRYLDRANRLVAPVVAY